jgi:hypothetical protein
MDLGPIMLLSRHGDSGFRMNLQPKGLVTWASASCDLVKELPSILRLNFSPREVATHLVSKERGLKVR